LEGEFEKVKILPDLLGWPKPKSESFSTNLASAQAMQDRTIAQMALDLSQHARPVSLPDFAGEFLARTANHLVDSLFDSTTSDFEEIFPVFWKASLAKFSMLLGDQETAGQDGYVKFAQSAVPLLDLLEISGFAILMSEMKETPAPWQALKDLWDGYFVDPKAGAMRIQIVDNALRLAEMPMMTPGDMPRHQWRMRADDWLRQSLGIEPAFYMPQWTEAGSQPVHPRPLIRVLARDTFPGMRRGSDIFGAMYFRGFLGEQASGGRVRFNDLANSIRLETRRDDRNPLRGENVDEPPTTY
jgi:hypothetical protein